MLNSALKSKSKSNSRLSVRTKTRIDTREPGILLRGWFKYLEINPSALSQDFEVNSEFAHYDTVLPTEEKMKSDKGGKLDIPDEKSFFFVLTTRSINILSSRRNMITKTLDVIDLNIVSDITMGSDSDGNMVYQGGLVSMGVFDEGKCFQLLLKVGVK